jgi:hypothetical protein
MQSGSASRSRSPVSVPPIDNLPGAGPPAAATPTAAMIRERSQATKPADLPVMHTTKFDIYYQSHE